MNARPLVRGAALALVLAAAGCGLGVDSPTHARVNVAVPLGATGGVVRLITSSVFSADVGSAESIELLVSDTALVALPFEREIEMEFDRGQRKLYVEVAPSDDTERAVRMQVHIGSERWYDAILEMPTNRHRFLYMGR